MVPNVTQLCVKMYHILLVILLLDRFCGFATIRWAKWRELLCFIRDAIQSVEEKFVPILKVFLSHKQTNSTRLTIFQHFHFFLYPLSLESRLTAQKVLLHVKCAWCGRGGSGSAVKNLCLVTGWLSDISQSCQLAPVGPLNKDLNNHTLSSMFGLGSLTPHLL